MTNDQERAIARQQEMQRRTEMHARNLSTQGKDDNPKTLEYLAETDEGPELRDDSLDHLLHKNISTANLTEAEVRGIEWENEIAMLRRLQEYPPTYGITGYLRAFAFQDIDAYREPIDSIERIKQQGLGTLSKLAATRSEEFIGVDTSTRDTQETIVNDSESDDSGGMVRRWRD